MSKPIILVTGATGKTGIPVVEQLVEHEFPVHAFVHRVDERSDRLKALGAEVFPGDFLDLQSVRSAMQGAKRVYFCYPPQSDRLLKAGCFSPRCWCGGARQFVSDVCAGESREPAGPPSLAVGKRAGLGQHRRLAHQSDLLCGRPLSLHRPKHRGRGQDVSPLR